MNFVSIRIVTENIKRLVGFYETITGLAARWSTDDFAEVETQACTLAISSTRAMARFQPGAAARAAENRSVILEFRVGDVDAEYRRLGDASARSSRRPRPCPGATVRCCSAIPTAT